MSQQGLPNFLYSFENLSAHFDEHFGELGANERGDSFLELAKRLIPLTEEGERFPAPVPNEKKSHDLGVDLLTAVADDGRMLCAQSKFKIRGKDDIDTIISKFHNFDRTLQPAPVQESLSFVPEESRLQASVPVFCVITSSKIDGIIGRYESSTLSSVGFYKQLNESARLFFVDGPRILTILQNLYRKANLPPASIILLSLNGWTQQEDVALGAVAGQSLVELYHEYGDALFFENIRDFLGTTSGRVVTTRSTVNQEIIETISREPAKMLGRNNGITIRAETIEIDGGRATLTNPAIVNGCQTTMCLVRCAPVNASCFVQTKIVRSSDAWDIAKAANYQNQIARVDLDLARYLRPQLVRRVATELGYAIDAESINNASAVLSAIYQHRVDYEELKLLVLGVFSRTPNNLFEGNYAELRGDLLEGLYGHEGGDEKVFSVLLLMLKEGRSALNRCAGTYSGEEYAPLFKRFFEDNKPRYRVYLTIVTMCALQRKDLSSRSSETEPELNQTRSFLEEAKRVLENTPHRFREVFLLAFQAVADSLLDTPPGRTENEIAQTMYHKISNTAFSSLYKKVLMRVDASKALTEV